MVPTLQLETALIAPPIGFNLHMVYGVRSCGAMAEVKIALLPACPDITLWVPGLFY